MCYVRVIDRNGRCDVSRNEPVRNKLSDNVGCIVSPLGHRVIGYYVICRIFGIVIRDEPTVGRDI